MLFCPNLNNKQVKKEFDELRDIFGEATAYYMWDKNGGYSLDKAPNGAESKLFNDHLSIYHGNRVEAIRAKAKTLSPLFLKWFGDWTSQDATDVSKCVDENGEPRVMWHGGAKDVREFKPSGDNTGSGYYTDPNTGEKIRIDSENAMFFSTNVAVGLSYRLLYGINYYRTLHLKLESVVFNSTEDGFRGESGVISSKEDFIQLLDQLGEFNQRFKKAADYVRNIDGGISKNLNAPARKVLLLMLKDALRDVRDVADMQGWSAAVSDRINGDLGAIRFVSKYNTKEGRAKLKRGEISDEWKREWDAYKAKERNRKAAGESEIANNEQLIVHSTQLLGWFAYDGNGWYVGDKKYLSQMDDSLIERILSEIKSDAEVDIQNLRSDDRFRRLISKSLLYPVYINVKNPLSYDYEGTMQGGGFKESKKFPFGYVAARQVKKALNDGNDGVVYKNLYDPFFADNYGVFSSNQIKSVFNYGTFGLGVDDIYNHIAEGWDYVTNMMAYYKQNQLLDKIDDFGRYFFLSRDRSNDKGIVERLQDMMLPRGFDVLYYPGKYSKYGRRYIKIKAIPATGSRQLVYDSLASDSRKLTNVRDIMDVVEDLLKVFPGLQYGFMERDEANKIGINPAATSFVAGGVVYFIIGEHPTIDTVLEECLHPLITGIQLRNPTLFENLLNEAKSRYKKLAAEIEKNYDKDHFTDQDRENELVTQALARELREVRKNPKGTISKFMEMFYEIIEGFFKRLKLHTYKGKHIIRPQDLPEVLSMKTLALMIHTRDAQFLTTYLKRVLYHLQNQPSHEYTDKLVQLLSKQYDKQRAIEKTFENQDYQDKIFYTLSDIKAKADLESVSRVARFAVTHIGTADTADKNTLLGQLYDSMHEPVPFSSITPQRLFDIYNNEIVFLLNVVDVLPTESAIIDNPTFTGMDRGVGEDIKTIRNSLVDVLGMWQSAIKTVGDRVIDELVEKYVTETGARKDLLKQNMRDELHENLLFGDVGWVFKFSNYSFSTSDVVKAAFHEILDAEQKAREKTLEEEAPIMSAYKKVRSLLPGNQQRDMMEYDDNGNPTGYWVRRRNYGQFSRDYDEFLTELAKSFKDRYGHFYASDETGAIVNSETGEYADDEEWTIDQNGYFVSPIYYRWKREENDWLSQHCVRRYTYEYYDEMMSEPFVPGACNGHGLSPKTQKIYAKIRQEINYFLERCTHEDDGIAHVEELTDEQRILLGKWQAKLKDVTNPFDERGNLKSPEELKVAYEIRAWQKWENEQLKQTIDMDKFNEESGKLVAEKRKAQASGDLAAQAEADRKIRIFYESNAVRYINQEFIDMTIGLFESIKQPESADVTKARINVRALTNLTLTDPNTIEPQLEQFENNPGFFWQYLINQKIIEDLGSKVVHPDTADGARYDEVFKNNFYYADVLYKDANGYYRDVNGNPTTDKTQAVTFYMYLKDKYINEIKMQRDDPNRRPGTPATLYGLTDPNTGVLIDFSNYTDDEIEQFVTSILTVTKEIEVEDPNTHAKYTKTIVLPTNIFKYLMPKFGRFQTKRTDEITGKPIDDDTIKFKPVGRFVQKTNDPKSSYTLIDDRYDKAEGGNRQPNMGLYDNSKAYDKVMNDPNMRALYEILTKTQAGIIKDLNPSIGSYDYRLPQIEGSLSAVTSRIQHAGLRRVSEYIKQAMFGILAKDYDMRRGTQIEINPDGTPNGKAPRRFISFIDDPSVISSNLVGGVLLMLLMRNNYNLKNEALAKVFTLYENLNPEHRPKDNSKNAVNVQHSAKNMFRVMKNMITTHIMDMRDQGEFDASKSSVNNKNVAAQKILAHSKTLSMLSMLCGNILSAVVGFEDSVCNHIAGALSGKYYNARDWVFGLFNALGSIGHTLVNIGNPIPNCKLVALMRLNGISKSLSSSYEKLYESRAGKLVRGAIKIGIGAGIGHLIGNELLGGYSALMWAGAGMGVYSAFDYFTNQILLSAMYHSIRFYNGYTDSNGNYLVEPGFYTKRQLKRAFQNAGLGNKTKNTWMYRFALGRKFDGYKRAWFKSVYTLYDAYLFSNGKLTIKEQFKPYVTDKLKTLVSTMTQKRAALFNGMNPDNDVPFWKNLMIGKIISALRNFMVQSLQHNYVSGHSFVYRSRNVNEDTKTKNGRTKNEKHVSRGELTPDLNAERGGFDWESDNMLDSLVTELCRGAVVLGKMIINFLKSGSRGGYRFSVNCGYAVKEALAVFLVMLCLAKSTHNAIMDVKDNVTPFAGSAWNPNDWIDKQMYKVALMTLQARTLESQWSAKDPFQMYDLVTSVTTLTSGMHNYLEIVNAVEDATGFSGHEPDEIIKSGAYKGETRSTRQIYKFLGVPSNLHTIASYDGAVANYTWYLNKNGTALNLFSSAFHTPGLDEYRVKQSGEEERHGIGIGPIMVGPVSVGPIMVGPVRP